MDSPLLNDNKITGCRNVLLLIVSGSEEITIDEIGEINDFIQGEAGNNANIIMGVGEDETLGSSISVTIIATGFAADQQHEIVNAEAKKIIHNLEDEQKMEHQLLDVEAANEVEPVFVPKPQVESEPVVVHRLEEMEDETEITTGVQDILEETVTDTSLPIEETDTEELDEEALRNLDVVYELIQPSVPANIETAEALETIEAEEEKFVFNDMEDEVREIEVVAPELILPEENQFSLDFEMSLDTVKSETTATVDKESSKEESIEKYDLEAAQIPDTVHENEEIFQVSEKESISETPEVVSDTNPFEQTITASVRRENEKRKEQLKQFNYAFKNNIHHIEEMERQPAYKRQGVDLDDTAASTGSSRITLDTDSNDQIQLRSNNSFLHDNVD